MGTQRAVCPSRTQSEGRRRFHIDARIRATTATATNTRTRGSTFDEKKRELARRRRRIRLLLSKTSSMMWTASFFVLVAMFVCSPGLPVDAAYSEADPRSLACRASVLNAPSVPGPGTAYAYPTTCAFLFPMRNIYTPDETVIGSFIASDCGECASACVAQANGKDFASSDMPDSWFEDPSVKCTDWVYCDPLEGWKVRELPGLWHGRVPSREHERGLPPFGQDGSRRHLHSQVDLKPTHLGPPLARGRLCSGRRGMGQHVHVRHVRLEPRHQHSIRERLRERESESVSGACACEGDGSTSVGSGSVFSHHVFVMHRGGTRMRASFLLFFSFSHSLCCASESFICSDSMPVFLSCKE